MVIELRPNRGGYLRPFGCGWFIREYLMGHGPEGSTPIDPERGAPQSDINYAYKVAMAAATARARAEKRISRLVLDGVDVTEEMAEDIYQRELNKISHKFTRMRYHSFLKYFGTLKKLGCTYKGMLLPGEDAVCSGEVINKEVKDNARYIECKVWVQNPRGEKTASGLAAFTLP